MLLISCKGGSGQNNREECSQITFLVDTVVIDPGEEVIFLKYGLLNADISEDRKYLFNFNLQDHTIEKINLDELRLEAKLPFEKEGPNGTGAGLGIMKVVDNKHVSITGMYQSSLFSMDGQKRLTVYYENFSLAEWHLGGDLLKADRVILTLMPIACMD